MGARQLAQQRRSTAETGRRSGAASKSDDVLPSDSGEATSIINTTTGNPSSLTCTACWDSTVAGNAIQCSHNNTFCQTCVEQVYQVTILNNGPIPPVCCENGALPREESMWLLSRETQRAVLETLEERINNRRAEVWTSLADEQALHNLAQDRGWQFCPNCGRCIEKDEGCDHISCSCGENFCYKCGAVLGRCKHFEPDFPQLQLPIARCGPRHGWLQNPRICRHPREIVTAIPVPGGTGCCTHDRQRSRCGLCGFQWCGNCRTAMRVNVG